jgi:hypothetical protein
LAVTFTNKAAGEMKERIIRELDKLAAGEKSEYVNDICNRYPQYTPDQVAERAKSIRSAILHNYSDFNLRTIDSFVQSIVRAFCYDININSGFTTQTDQNAVIADLINVLLQRQGVIERHEGVLPGNIIQPFHLRYEGRGADRKAQRVVGEYFAVVQSDCLFVFMDMDSLLPVQHGCLHPLIKTVLAVAHILGNGFVFQII